MSRNIYGQQWRGLQWADWLDTIQNLTLANLKNIIKKYSQEPSADLFNSSDRIYLIEQTMRILDKQVPALDNKQIKQIFINSTLSTSNIDEKSSLVNHNARPKQTPGSRSPEVDAAAVITSYLKSMHLQRMRQTLSFFLKQEYNQSTCLEKGKEPYLPVSRVIGGLTISTATDLESSLKSEPRKIAQLRVVFPAQYKERQLYFFHSKGQPFAYRGRGPIWDKNSCAIDCCLVVARLLNLGITTADRGLLARDDWLKSLMPLERHFLQMTGLPWENISNSVCIKIRNAFYESLLNVMNKSTKTQTLQIGSFFQATAIWKECTSNMQQFSFSDCRHSECTACKHQIPKGSPRPNLNQDLVVDGLTDDMKKDRVKLNWPQLIKNYFDSRLGSCRKCGRTTKVERRRVYGKLPPRLVVLPSPDYRDAAIGVNSHSITIEYEDSEGNLQKAIYRWLGGIFRANFHFRVYWTDEKQGEDTGRMMIYDGQLLDGSIIGSVNPRGLERKVPEHWGKETDMLFFERIDLLNSERFRNTASLLKSDIELIERNVLETRQKTQTVQPEKVTQLGSVEAPKERSAEPQTSEMKTKAEPGDSKSPMKASPADQNVLAELQTSQIIKKTNFEGSEFTEQVSQTRLSMKAKEADRVELSKEPEGFSMQPHLTHTKSKLNEDPHASKEAFVERQESQCKEEAEIETSKLAMQSSIKNQVTQSKSEHQAGPSTKVQEEPTGHQERDPPGQHQSKAGDQAKPLKELEKDLSRQAKDPLSAHQIAQNKYENQTEPSTKPEKEPKEESEKASTKNQSRKRKSPENSEVSNGGSNEKQKRPRLG